MYRYIAFSWNAKDPARTAAAQRLTRLLLSTAADWQSVLDVPGLRVFHAPHAGGACHAYVLKRDGGVVLGQLLPAPLFGELVFKDPAQKDASEK